MRRFKYTTGTHPETHGEGVAWDDGVAVYREKVHGEWTATIGASVKGIEESYGGQNDYRFEWIDGSPKADRRR